MRFDISFLPALAAAFLLVFARVGTMVMLLPAIGDQSVSSRARLTIALMLAAILLPLHRDAYVINLNALGPVVILLFEEMLVGLVLGMTARLAVSALQIAGAVIAQQLGLGSIVTTDPSQHEQGVIFGNFLTMLGIALIFATDLHHVVIMALNDSYKLFHPGEIPVIGDVAQLVTRTIATAFRIGIQLSAPFLVFGLLFNIGLGVLARLMPQMQVYFIGLPLSIVLGFGLFLAVLGAMMGTFVGYFEGVLAELVRP